MCGYGQCTAEHSTYVNHLMGCRKCFAPSANHCEEGWGLKLHADARFVAGLADIADRRRWMARLRIEIPERMTALEELVREKYAESRA